MRGLRLVVSVVAQGKCNEARLRRPLPQEFDSSQLYPGCPSVTPAELDFNQAGQDNMDEFVTN